MVTNLIQTGHRDDGGLAPAKPKVSLGGSTDSSSVRTPPPEDEEASKGRLDVKGSETSYLGATHWAAIINHVSRRSNTATLQLN